MKQKDDHVSGKNEHIVTQSKLTMKDMCETIEKAGILEKKDGTAPTAKEIFEYSSTGELFMIFEWYAIAKKILAG